MIRQLFAFNSAGFSLKRGLLGASVVTAILLTALVAGRPGLLGALGALLVMATGFAGRLEERLRVALGAVVIGALMCAVVLTFGVSAWGSVILLVIGTFLCSIVMAEGGPPGKVAGLLNMLLAVEVGLADREAAYPWPALGFVIGGLFAMAVLYGLHRLKAPLDEDLDSGPLLLDWSAVARRALDPYSSTFQFAAIRAVAVGVSAACGWLLFDVNPFWPTISTLIVLQPDVDKAVLKGVQRGIGTLLGAIIGLAVLQYVHSPALLLAVAFASTVFFVAVVAANYLWFSAALTIMLLSLYGLGTRDLTSVGYQRVDATIVGVIIAVVAAWALERVARRLTVEKARP